MYRNLSLDFLNSYHPAKLALFAAFQCGVVRCNPRQRAFIASDDSRFENAEEIANEAIEPFATLTCSPDYPKLVGSGPDRFVNVASSVKDCVDVGIPSDLDRRKPHR